MPAVIIHGEEDAVKSLMDKYMEHKGKVRAFKVGEVANWGPEMCEIIEVDGDDIFAKLGPNKGWYTKEEINNLGLDWRKAEESNMAGREVTAQTNSSDEELFNLITPIYIYNYADVRYKDKAQAAFNKLKTMGYLEDAEELDDVNEEVWAIYDKLVIKMAEEYMPSFEPTHDNYGAQCFIPINPIPSSSTKNGKLAGDSLGHFAIYEDYDMLVKDMQEIEASITDSENREVTAKRIDDVYYPNYDDYKESFWKNNYEVKVTENGITFIVNADNEQEAFDYIIDYCEEKLPGLVSSYDELKEDGYNDQEMEDFIQGGNHGLYLTTHYVNLHEIGERKAQKGLGGPRLQDGGVSTCVCPKCGYKMDHDRGKPCLETNCPKCGAKMLGERKAQYSGQSVFAETLESLADVIKEEGKNSMYSYDRLEKLGHPLFQGADYDSVYIEDVKKYYNKMIENMAKKYMPSYKPVRDADNRMYFKAKNSHEQVLLGGYDGTYFLSNNYPYIERAMKYAERRLQNERKADLTEREVGNARTKLEDVKLDLQEWLSTVKRKYQTSGKELPESIIEKTEKANSIISNMMAAL